MSHFSCKDCEGVFQASSYEMLDDRCRLCGTGVVRIISDYMPKGHVIACVEDINVVSDYRVDIITNRGILCLLAEDVIIARRLNVGDELYVKDWKVLGIHPKD